MLQKGFFMTEPFNPRPYWDNTIVNLSGAAKFEEDTVFKIGRYKVEIQAGSSYKNGQVSVGAPALLVEEIVVREPFIVRAYCGSMATQSTAGINPYVGEFKVNAHTAASDVPAVTHIFGNSGSPSLIPGTNGIYAASSGNCLGDGAYSVRGREHQGTGAGSCLHLLPVGGVFGTDYLFAFHTTAGAVKGSLSFVDGGGVGSAYGGAGSGSSYYAGSSGLVIGKSYSFSAGSTPYGMGGAGVWAAASYQAGNSGMGVGSGTGGGVSADGVGAWFDGTSWHDVRTTGTASNGFIVVTYLGTFN